MFRVYLLILAHCGGSYSAFSHGRNIKIGAIDNLTKPLSADDFAIEVNQVNIVSNYCHQENVSVPFF